jgi:hypothetical protein
MSTNEHLEWIRKHAGSISVEGGSNGTRATVSVDYAGKIYTLESEYTDDETYPGVVDKAVLSMKSMIEKDRSQRPCMKESE